jgi:putative membrane protein
MSGSDLPLLNACLNSVTTVLLVIGFVLIHQGKKEAHRKVMVAALITSTLFLISYLIYHFGYQLTTKFEGQGWVRPLYFFILISHIILAMVNLPMILTTVYFAATKQFERHRAIARWTWPIWFYVSITGVLVYLMLYVWFPGTSPSNS